MIKSRRNKNKIYLSDAQLKKLVHQYQTTTDNAAKNRAAEAVLDAVDDLMHRLSFGWNRTFPHYSVEEAMQAARIGVLSALNAFDPSKAKDCKFTSYVATWIRSNLRRTVDKECFGPVNNPINDNKDRERHGYVPWDEDCELSGNLVGEQSAYAAGHYAPHGAEDLEMLDLHHRASQLMNEVLTPREVDILTRHYQGEIMDTIAADYNLTRQAIGHAKLKAEKKLKQNAWRMAE